MSWKQFMGSRSYTDSLGVVYTVGREQNVKEYLTQNVNCEEYVTWKQRAVLMMEKLFPATCMAGMYD